MKQAIRSNLLAGLLLLSSLAFGGHPYPMKSKTLANGLKVIVCEKSTNPMAEIQVWYRVGSKDEWDGVRGMAHLFEHMMFRGSKKFNGEMRPDKVIERAGGNMNAYTTYDRTVYHEEVPVTRLEQMIEMEADRMENLLLDQKLLDTEREVVGEELRLGENNWYNRMSLERYRHLYPKGHPYAVEVIGNLDEITSFTTKQCQEFYDKFYSPNNAFVVITGNVKADEIFALCEKYFGSVKKQLPPAQKIAEPDIFANKIEVEELFVDFPVQIYSYVIPMPPVGHKDYYAYMLFSELMFTNSNSLLNKRLVNANLAYGINGSAYDSHMYGMYMTFDVIMQAQVGNAKVKKEISREINALLNEGLEENLLSDYIRNLETQEAFLAYSNSEINALLGFAEYYFNDYTQYAKMMEEYKKITVEDLKAIARRYFNPETMKVINVKPLEKE